MVYGKTPFGDLHLYAKLQAITDARHAIATPANTPLATPDALDCVRGCLEREPSQRLEISSLLCHAFLDPRSSKITSAQIQKAVHDALAKQDCRVDADKLAKDVSATLLDEPKTLAAAIAGVTLQSASLPNKYQKDKAEQQPDGLAGLMQRGFAQMAPVAEEGTGGSDMDVTATNASGWTTGV
jgi:serine/threonine protein kinase